MNEHTIYLGGGCFWGLQGYIKKISGVNDATVSFMTQKLTLDYDEQREEEILAQAKKACQKVDGACNIL